MGCIIIIDNENNKQHIELEKYAKLLIKNDCSPRIFTILKRSIDDPMKFFAKGMWGNHTINFSVENKNQQIDVVSVNKEGDCDIRVDSVNGSLSKSINNNNSGMKLKDVSVQAIDACFWTKGWRRCEALRVLHIDLSQVMSCLVGTGPRLDM